MVAVIENQHIDPIVPIHIQDAPSDVPVEYTNDLQETEADDEVKEVK